MTSGNKDAGCRNAKEKLAKLRTEESVIMRSCRSSISAIRMCDQRLANDINIVTRELEETRKHEKTKINQDISEIFEELVAVQNVIKRDESLLDFNPKSCKEKLMQLQSRILQTRDYLEKEIFILKNEEKTLFDEVCLAQQRIEDYSKYDSLPTSHYKFVNAKVTKQMKNFNTAKDEDIQNFEKFLEIHGHCGGWDEQDHLLFLRARKKLTKQKDHEKLYSMLTAQLPDLTSKKITQHVRWFEEYEKLREKNKLAIQRWKESKLKEKERRRSSERKGSIGSLDTNAENELRKQEIALWKKKKEQEKEEQEKRLQEKREAEQLQEKLERNKHKKAREKIEIMKQERQRCEESAKAEQKLLEAEIRRERAEEARKMIKSYRKMDEMHIEKLKLLRLTRKDKREPLQLPAPRLSAPRNPDRLLQMTQVWRAKCKIDEMESRGKFPQPTLHVRNIPHL
ncbi:Hypothetical predicted protein [Cloeon dipterum]|uniref:Coiled-coil domain-containing protein 112 n=2 Tax=Cloeon dipterum TaxID=197152 RepID=A0A8S1DU66_9INSE|nr:Hypothetical predicted protein [Cloeon dipterum]